MVKSFNQFIRESVMEPNIWHAVLIGGLDYRSGDLTIDQQVEQLKKTYGSDKRIKGFRYKEPTKNVLDFLLQNPNMDIYMFSAGCSKAEEISKLPMIDKKKIFIIEPYAVSSRTKKIVEAAVTNGVPAKNVIVGPNKARGKDVVTGATDSNSSSHWGALKSYSSNK